MKKLSVTLKALLVDTIAGEGNGLVKVTEHYHYKMSFEEAAVFAEVKDNLVEHTTSDPWFSTDKSPAVMEDIVRAALEAYESVFGDFGEMYQVFFEGDVIIFHSNNTHGIRLSVTPFVGEPVEEVV